FEPEADLFLEELISLDGRGCWPSEMCIHCMIVPGVFQCRDCSGREMVCGGCIVDTHKRLYLHRIQEWNGVYFETSSLKKLGLRVQLGHRFGERCFNSERCTNDDFVIIDIHGIHEVGIDFCGCGKSDQRHTVQLLRANLFPATVKQPKTAATTRVLELFELLSYESKASAFEFYNTLSRLTDNTGISPPKDRYLALLRMAHEWRHLKMLKRTGRGHDPKGIVSTKPGECAVLCPACPQPGKNMMPGWEYDSPERRYLHTLFLALDANFRMKRKNVSSDSADPGLSKGWSYFVVESWYKAHIQQHANDTKSTCSRHDAVNLADSRPGQSYAATGIGAVTCRHDMKRPSSVGDLQVSERYCNMDFLFYQTLKGTEVLIFVISYDIACQWSINIYHRMFELDHEFFLFDNTRYVRFLVPKFHLPAHVEKCRTNFSFNYTKNVGRTDGESPERGWVNLNVLAPSTREMGPGRRRDTIDCNIGDENWKKFFGMGQTLRRKIIAAAKDMAELTIAHQQLESTLPSASIDQWTKDLESWEADPSKPNPFEITVTGPTLASVRRQLVDDEAKDLAEGRDSTLDSRVSLFVLISEGVDLEAEQRAIGVSGSKLWEHAKDRQHTKHQLRCNALQRKIDHWFKYQALYFPEVVKLRQASSNSQSEVKIQDIPLWLPSQIKGKIPVTLEAQRIEWRLRNGQAYEALDTLQFQLQLRAHLRSFKNRFVRGQGPNTRARKSISLVQEKIDIAARDYRRSYEALEALGSIIFKYGWHNELKPLLDEDIRELSEGEDKKSDGKRTVSWIWRIKEIQNLENDTHLNDLRVEWCKSRARAHRFTEEVSLLSEEMVRVTRFLTSKASEWEAK
ncbi:hypothetical protein M413DRAFT_56267, partial [Hebeloma cylindrosporum]